MSDIHSHAHYAPMPPREAETDAEKLAFAYGWSKAMEQAKGLSLTPYQRAKIMQEEGLEWADAVKDAIEQDGFGNAEIYRICSHSLGSCPLVALIDVDELRDFVRSVLVFQHAPQYPQQSEPKTRE